MKKLLLFVVLAFVAKLAVDAFASRRTDREMLRAAEEMNRKLPIGNEFVRLDQVAYSNRTVHVSGTLLTAQALSEEGKALSRKMLTEGYCRNSPVLLKANMSVEYAFSKATLANMNDKLRAESWTVTLRPQDCR